MKYFIFLLMIAQPVVPSFSFAQGSGHTGGDACELAIDDVRRDMINWIGEGGSKALDLSSINLTHEEYARRMLSVLRDDTVVIECPDELPNPIRVNQVRKTCDNWLDSKSVQHIRCDWSLFNQASTSIQYQLVHHEFASMTGIGIEKHSGAKSDYTISNQVIQSRKPVMIYRLSAAQMTLNAHLPDGLNSYTRPIVAEIFESLKVDLIEQQPMEDATKARRYLNQMLIFKRLKQLYKAQIHLLVIEDAYKAIDPLAHESHKQVRVYDQDSKVLLFTKEYIKRIPAHARGFSYEEIYYGIMVH